MGLVAAVEAAVGAVVEAVVEAVVAEEVVEVRRVLVEVVPGVDSALNDGEVLSSIARGLLRTMSMLPTLP